MIKKGHKTDLVIIQMPFWGVGCPPLGPALLKSFLRENDVSCTVLDLNAYAYNFGGKKYRRYWDMANGYNYCMEREAMQHYYKENRAIFLEYMQRLRELNPLVVGCSCQCSSRLLAEIFFEDMHNMMPGEFIHLLGGPDVASFMENTDTLLARDYIHAISQDEGENALLGYMQMVKNGQEGQAVPGFVYKHNGKLIRGPHAEFIKKLDSLPFPDFSDFEFKYYDQPNTLPTYTTRGCVNKCNYCSAIGFMNQFRVRTAERVFAEIKYQLEQYPNVCYFRMCDNISNSKINELEKFCDLMIESGLNKRVKWNLENAVIRKEMRMPLYKKLKKAGCTLLGYGMETPSLKVLMDVGKNLCKDVDIAAVLREGKKSGLYVSVNIMFGLPTETEDDFKYLMDFLRDNKKAFSMVNPSLNFCEYYPGSAGHANPEKYGIDLSKGHLYWESLDGNSTYLKRMERFEEFCKKAKEYKLDNLFDVEELPNKHKLLFEYYFVSKEYDNALKEFKLIKPEDVTEEIEMKVKAIETGDFSPLEKEEKIIPLDELLPYGRNFEETLILTSLLENIENLEKEDAYPTLGLKDWKIKLRNLFHKIIGYKHIEKRINSTLQVQKVLDAKIRAIYGSRELEIKPRPKQSIQKDEKLELAPESKEKITV
ncbi:MAG TPA: radical SAM protein [Candidatus Omnitrophota bacterium]|nr:radical SAM protein [Candidatus Omnitrophota bacterium]